MRAESPTHTFDSSSTLITYRVNAAVSRRSAGQRRRKSRDTLLPEMELP